MLIQADIQQCVWSKTRKC